MKSATANRNAGWSASFKTVMLRFSNPTLAMLESGHLR
jgi:hypothetical protein